MRKYISLLKTVWIWTLFGGLAAQAQDTTVSLRFSCLAWEGVNATGLKYREGANIQELRVSPGYRSEVYEYHGPNPIVFFREEAGADGRTVEVPVASASIVEGQNEVLVIFFAVAEERTDRREFDVLVLDERESVFPYGSYRIFNLTPHEVGGIIGEERFILPSRETAVVSPEAEDMVDVQIHFSKRVDGQWVPNVNTRWNYRENARGLVFITEDANSRFPRLRLRTFTQYQKEE